MDYANYALYGVTQKNLDRLRRVQCSLARVVAGPKASMLNDSDTLLCNSHWLPVMCRIDFKLAVLTFKARSATAPTHLSNLIKSHAPVRTLRSSTANLLHLPAHKLSFGSSGFRIAAPAIWNSLPTHIRFCTTLSSFRSNLKTHYYHSALG